MRCGEEKWGKNSIGTNVWEKVAGGYIRVKLPPPERPRGIWSIPSTPIPPPERSILMIATGDGGGESVLVAKFVFSIIEPY